MPLGAALHKEDPDAICTLLQSLAAPINAFFDTTMVMAEDPEIRSSRLALLQIAQNQLLTAGDFTKIVIEG
jgi:Glycyl-tRNA synthetase, beta subunit